MDKYRPPPLPRKEFTDCRRRKFPAEDDGQRSTPYKKMRPYKDKENANDDTNNTNDSSNWNRRSRSPPAGLDPHHHPLTSKAHKTPLPHLPPPRSKVVNWRLACFMAREYLSRGTLLGKPWPQQDSKPLPPQGDESCREKEALYSLLSTDFLRSDDVHIPGIVNPSQLAAWLEFE